MAIVSSDVQSGCAPIRHAAVDAVIIHPVATLMRAPVVVLAFGCITTLSAAAGAQRLSDVTP